MQAQGATASANSAAMVACPAAEALIAGRRDDSDSQARLGEAYRSCFESSRDREQARKAADAYVQAALLASQKGDVRYTREVSELLVQLQDKTRLQEVFGKILDGASSKPPDRQYLVLVDYADALASLHDESAWSYFERAIELRPGNNVEAINRYARHLIDEGQPQKAIEVLETRMTPEQRVRFGQPAYLRQEAMRRAGLDTGPADAEVAQIQGRRARSRPPR
jgi:hypothetical protein